MQSVIVHYKWSTRRGSRAFLLISDLKVSTNLLIGFSRPLPIQPRWSLTRASPRWSPPAQCATTCPLPASAGTQSTGSSSSWACTPRQSFSPSPSRAEPRAYEDCFAPYSRRRYRSPSPRSPSSSAPPESVPGVSILRPLRGLDTNLFENLESTFRQEYPNFEIIFSVANEYDQALPVVQNLLEKYPNFDARVIIGTSKPFRISGAVE